MEKINVLFMTIGGMRDVQDHSLYCDFLRPFRDAGHSVYTISPAESGEETKYEYISGVNMLHIKTADIARVSNLVKKGMATLSLEPNFIKGIKKYLGDVKFDLIIYSTPPITFCNAISYVKKRDGAKTYLLLKDIFPQNSVDLGMLSKSGIKGLIYKYFRLKEKKLYRISDKIGCMSEANCEFVLKHNSEIDPKRVEVCPNCIEPIDMSVSDEERDKIREEYGLPLDKKIFVYGGNLGKPQDVSFVVKCLRACAHIDDAFFVVAGSGTDRHLLEEYINTENPSHVKLFGHIPKNEYDKMVACCDVGLIFLDNRFTIPNFPSRLLSYMQARLPVLTCTDKNTDIGDVVCNGGFGWQCESDDEYKFAELLEEVSVMDNYDDMKEAEWKYLNENYNVKVIYERCFSHLEAEE